ncbi:hypothetical protein I203_107428 [Kwoniella mangroviensis CBS 8507]|uniref:hypothetical protein n=1 Tax=Kwoniella mangroviensis CBS 8507 TaxID=1296122 RepID=UPI0030710D8F
MSVEYTNMNQVKKTKRSKLEMFMNRLPYYFSYVILISTWILFMLFITLGEVLLKRREVGRFAEQSVIYNSLLFLTLISLATTANRSPGVPDQTLAPPNKNLQRHVTQSDRSENQSIQNYTIEEYAKEEDIDDEDDNLPLRYLRNAQWVNTRIGKDRPSPLPLPNTRRYPSPSIPDRTEEEEQRHESATDSDSGSEFSPFPLSAKSPFVPSTAVDAGEDDEDLLEDLRLTSPTEGAEEMSTSLLRSEDGAGDGGRSLMAKSNNGETRWCKKCNGWKPDRCHHCRHCEQCVLKMDHHCPWVGTCVGYHNYKPFFLFINCALLLAIYATFEAGYETYRFFQDPSGAVPYRAVQMEVNQTLDTASIAANDNWSDGLGISPAIFMMLTVMGGFMSLAVGGLVVFHWYLTLNNQTTLENITHSYPSALLDGIPKGAQWKADHLLTRSERNRLRWEAREINVYDLGWRKNLKILFLGEERDITMLGVIQALWPTGRPSRYDRRSGHFFAYNPHKFEKLRDLTMELRYGIVPEGQNKERSSMDSTVDGDEGEGEVDHRVRDQHDEGYELDQVAEKGLHEGASEDRLGRARQVKWFEV